MAVLRSPPDPLAELIQLFFRDIQPRLDAMEQAIGREDLSALAASAHTLKGSASNLGAVRMTRICAQIMSEVRNPTGLSLHELVAAVQAEMPTLREQLAIEILA